MAVGIADEGVSVPLRGFWYADDIVNHSIGKDIFVVFQSPYGDFGTLTRYDWHPNGHNAQTFQSPYGDFGTLTLSLSTRSLTGLTGDFFKPQAFFAFSGDPGEK